MYPAVVKRYRNEALDITKFIRMHKYELLGMEGTIVNLVTSVVVTFNRKKYLEENLNALLSQKDADTDIIVVDNASTDGTEALVKRFISSYPNRIHYINTQKNLGGAGGFNIGIKEAIKCGYKYAWIMDDDSIPEVRALSSLINKAEVLRDNFSFLGSIVLWTNGEIHPMNKISVNNHIYDDIDAVRNNNLIRIGNCSFVGCFLNLYYAKQTFLPITEFFIYGDDVEYTLRLAHFAKSYLDLDSIIVHKTPTKDVGLIEKEMPERLARYYYKYRNNIYIRRKQSKKAVLKYLFVAFTDALRIIKTHNKYKIKRIYILAKGCISGMFFNPKLEMPDSE